MFYLRLLRKAFGLHWPGLEVKTIFERRVQYYTGFVHALENLDSLHNLKIS